MNILDQIICYLSRFFESIRYLSSATHSIGMKLQRRGDANVGTGALVNQYRWHAFQILIKASNII